MAEPIGALRVAISMAAAQFEKDSAEVRSSVQRMEDRFQKMQAKISISGNQVSRELGKLTSSTELVSAGIRRMRSIVEGMVWGTAIAAVSAYAFKMLDSSRAADELAKKTDGVTSSLMSLSKQLNPSIKESEAMARAQFELARAKLFLAQATARATVEELKATIARMESTSVIERQSIAFMALKNLMEKGTPLVDLAKEEELAKGKTEELRGQLKVLEESLKTQIPTWDQFRSTIDKTKVSQQEIGQRIRDNAKWFGELKKNLLPEENVGRGLSQPFEVIEAEAIELQERIAQTNFELPFLVTDPSTIQAERDKIAAFTKELQEIQEEHDRKVRESRRLSYEAMNNFADAFFIVSGEKSKRAFKLWQNFTAGMAVGDAIGASLKALNHAPGPPETIPLAAAILSRGLLQAAKIKSLSFSGGGGGAGGGGGLSDVSSVPQTDRNLRGPAVNQHPPLIVNVNGIVIGEDAWVNESLIPRIEDSVRNERSKLAMKED